MVNWISAVNVPPEMMFEYAVELFDPEYSASGNVQWGIAYQSMQIDNGEQGFLVLVSAVPINGTPAPDKGGAASFSLPPYSGTWSVGLPLGPLAPGWYNLTVQQINEYYQGIGPIYQAATDLAVGAGSTPPGADPPNDPGGIDGGIGIVLPGHHLLKRANLLPAGGPVGEEPL
jgi:hypothetical protein